MKRLFLPIIHVLWISTLFISRVCTTDLFTQFLVLKVVLVSSGAAVHEPGIKGKRVIIILCYYIENIKVAKIIIEDAVIWLYVVFSFTESRNFSVCK